MSVEVADVTDIVNAFAATWNQHAIDDFAQLSKGCGIRQCRRVVVERRLRDPGDPDVQPSDEFLNSQLNLDGVLSTPE